MTYIRQMTFDDEHLEISSFLNATEEIAKNTIDRMMEQTYYLKGELFVANDLNDGVTKVYEVAKND